MKKHIIAFLIGLAGLINAQVATPPSFGDGTESNPYQIATLENLYWIAADTLNFHNHYIQTADIDAAETRNWFVGDHDDNPETPDEPMGWKPIGNFSEIYFAVIFDGTYDGQGHTIDSLYINHIPVSFEESMSGLFGWAQNATVRNLGITNCIITGGSNSGILAGSYNGTIENCYTTGTVSGVWAVGGLAGGAGGGIIVNCYSKSDVKGGNYNGGLIGYLESSSTISKSYSSGIVNCVYSGLGGTGGLVGTSEGNINNCFSTSDIYGEGETYGGGFVGRQEGGNIENCFSTGTINSDLSGGFEGSGYGNVVNSFWDTETSGVEISAAGTGLTSAEMKTKQTFLDAGWDFVGETENGTEDIWDMDGVTNNGYPFLNWIPHPIAIAPSAGDGTEGNPYQIATLENLYWISADTLNFQYHYIQTADIDASETSEWFVCDHDNDPETPDEPKGWKPIGGFSEVEALGYFSGSYNGQNHIIDYLYVNEITPSFSYSNTAVGLFGYTNNAVLKNIELTNVDIRGIDAGALTGLSNGDNITNCHSSGKIFGSWAAGGLVGESGGDFDMCSSNANVSGYNWTGGLIGQFRGREINRSYSSGNVKNIGTQGYGNGGLIGDNGGVVKNCFSTSNVEGDYVYGFAGYNYYIGRSENSFCFGNLTGVNVVGFSIQSDAPNCFWDVDATGVPEDSLTWTQAVGLTTAEMKTKQTYLDAGWDFVGETENGAEDIWDMDGVTNDGYPFLAWMTTTGIDDQEDLIPEHITLHQNYPNPFNPVTTIKFSIPATQNVKLAVYNSNGQLVSELLRGKMKAGNHSVMFNGDKLNSGIYFYRLDAEGKSSVKKMLLIK